MEQALVFAWMRHGCILSLAAARCMLMGDASQAEETEAWVGLCVGAPRWDVVVMSPFEKSTLVWEITAG